MRARPVIALSATLALLGGGSAVGAVGDAADAAATGAASSTLTLLDVGVGGTSLSVLELALRSDSLAGSASTSFVVTPLAAGGTAYGRQSVSSRSAALPAADSTRSAPAAVSAVAAARGPLVDVEVDGGTARAGTRSLGSVSVLGMPLALTGSASLSSVVDGAGASGTKTLTVDQLGLPSLAQVLSALGLDLKTLDAGSLTGLLDRLDLGSSTTAVAQASLEQALAPVAPQLSAAEALVAQTGRQVEAAAGQVERARDALGPATTTLNEATRALTGASGGLLRRASLLGLPTVPEVVGAPVTGVTSPVLRQPLPAPPAELVTAPATELVTDTVKPVVSAPISAVDATLDTVTAPVVAPVVGALPTLPAVLPLPTLPAQVPVGLQPVADAYTAAKKAYDDALQAVRDAEGALAAARGRLDDARAKVDALLAPHTAQVDAFKDAVLGVLDSTPLLSVDRLEVTTRSAVTSAAPGGQTAEVVGGEVEGLKVLGTDVLEKALGSSEVEVLDLAGPVKGKVDSALSTVTGTLSSALSSVPGLPLLEVPAPKVELLTRATSTDVVDGFGIAGAAVRAVSVTWPGLQLPKEAALPGAASLPAVAGMPSLPALRQGALVASAGDLVTQPLTLSLATLEDRARFRPARMSVQPGTGAPGTTTPDTAAPTTGAPTTGTPTTGTPTTGTPTTGTPTTDTPTTGTPVTAAPPTVPTGTQLPRTGTEPSALALLLLAAGLGLHRRCRTA